MRTQIAVVLLSAGLASASVWSADGDLDPSFANQGTYLIKADPGDELPFGAAPKLVTASSGVYTMYTRQHNNKLIRRITRLSGSGELSGHVDLDYLDQIYASSYFETLAVDNTGRIYVAGSASLLNNGDMLVCRLKSDGTPDASWGGNAGCTTIPFDLVLNGNDFATAIHLLADGRVLVAGHVAVGANIYTMAAARIDQDGNWDVSFGQGGKYYSSTSKTKAVDIDVDPSGRIFLGGNLDVDGCNSDMFVQRLSANGLMQASRIIKWDIGANCDGKKDWLSGIHALPDGSVWVSGGARFDSTVDWKLCTAKLTSDNFLLDGSYNGTGKTQQFVCDVCKNSEISSSALQSDGKMLVAGMTSVGSGTFELFVSRINPDGQPDYSLFSLLDYPENNESSADSYPSVGIYGGKPVIATSSVLSFQDPLVMRIAVSRLENDLIFADRFGM